MDRNLNGCFRAFFLFLIGSLALSCNRSGNQVETPTPTPEARLTPVTTATPTATPEATFTPAATATPTATPKATLSPAPTPSAETTTTAEPTLTPTPASTPSAGLASLPDEADMSKADRLRVQETLRRLGYYRGQADGIFGPLTRTAIRRFQSEIGAATTGRLTADEASRLVNTR